ncbi:hypothetical protein PIB30_020731 [Stylosanthes scabra]|uniref:Uncharacterized protein n=1 Tax=Stylosanthes scabra TaxID=79078 RepID=A0ABU6Y6V5_9FABA|nr:hypothetical protein [Stylosanthes scabra]
MLVLLKLLCSPLISSAEQAPPQLARPIGEATHTELEKHFLDKVIANLVQHSTAPFNLSIFHFLSKSCTLFFQSFRAESRKQGKQKGHHHLTQEKKQEIKEAFELFDTVGSGVNFSQGSGIVFILGRDFGMFNAIHWKL